MGGIAHQPKAGALLTGTEYEAADHHLVTLTAADVGAEAAGAVATHSADTTSVHGITDTAALVTLTGTQALTNKTITAIDNDVEADAVHVRVRNVSGVTLAIGTPVYITGYNAGQETVTVDLADASSAATMPALGLCTAAIPNNTNGTIEVIGRATGYDTSGFAVGDELFVSETAGVLTATAPSAPAIIQKVGTVVRSHATQGVIEVGIEAIATSAADVAAHAADTTNVHGIADTSLVRGTYVQAGDPGAVGAGFFWLDTSGNLRIRNSADAAWIEVVSVD